MQTKLANDKYATLEEFEADAKLIFENCRWYNLEDSIYWKQADKLQKEFNDSLDRHRPKEEE